MKITSFNPLIVTGNSAPIIKLFEELGFEKRHNMQASTGTKDFHSIRMKDANGFYVDVAEIPDFTLPQDLTLIRMNVDDFDEAYAFLTANGFKNSRSNDGTLDTRTSKSAMVISPSGFAFDLCQHIKDNKE